MDPVETADFNDLVVQFLGHRLPESLAGQIQWSALAPDARGVILRLLSLMQRSSCPATEFNDQMIWLLATVTPAMLPAAWGGRIPPLTSPGRHRKSDAYADHHVRTAPDERPVFIDLGCGFPPVTTVDTAGALPDWTVYGVDPAFFRYVLYDAEGRYACFDSDGRFQYFQSPAKPLNDTPEAVRKSFQSLFDDLSPRLPPSHDHERTSVGQDGHTLVSNAIRDYETGNLTCVKSNIEDLRLPPAHFIRCMNVLLYYAKKKRRVMLSGITESLADNGLLMTGFNHPFGIYARYAVYRKENAGLHPCEFAFSLDNLRPLGIGPWLTLAEEDEEAELLADLTGALRKDPHFWGEFAPHVDDLREKLGIGRRGEDGLLHFEETVQKAPPQVLLEKTTRLWQQAEADGHAARAVEALARAGYDAWLNPVGDIAVVPPDGALQAV